MIRNKVKKGVVSNMRSGKTCWLLLLLFFLAHNINGQESINASGASIKNATGSLSFSLGQVGYMSMQDHNCGVVTGVQQVYVHLKTTSVDIVQASCDVYPNPAHNYLKVRLSKVVLGKMHIKLFDITGKVVIEQEVQSVEEELNLKDLQNGVYVLRVANAESIIVSKKIIKR